MTLHVQGLIAKKIGMTRMVDAKGEMIPVTLLHVEPQSVTKVITTEKEGYIGVQVGYFPKREKLLRKPDLARLRKANVQENFTRFKEFRLPKLPEGTTAGTSLTTQVLDGVTAVDVTGISKGKGFEGAQKRWNAASGPAAHGSCYHNRPGSLGNRTDPGRVFKNKKVPGHLGDERCTVQNLAVMEINHEANVIALKGSVPGTRNGYVILKPSVKVVGKKQ